MIEECLCGITGSLERRCDDTVQADMGEVACGGGCLEATESVEGCVDLALDYAGDVVVCFSMANEEDS